MKAIKVPPSGDEIQRVCDLEFQLEIECYTDIKADTHQNMLLAYLARLSDDDPRKSLDPVRKVYVKKVTTEGRGKNKKETITYEWKDITISDIGKVWNDCIAFIPNGQAILDACCLGGPGENPIVEDMTENLIEYVLDHSWDKFRYLTTDEDKLWLGVSAKLIAEYKMLFHKLAISETGKKAFQHDYRSEEHTSELQSRLHLVCRLLLVKKKK